ncbi:erythromycin esterase family protein [Kribbella qitaiheensis]|uniref:Erythromycin esterase family protein n=1 Tax=Kribbella qitaiheensis TaxID=1544730 RepID=A0A7G6X8J5_9ACTN|nr:erythromycin esterase family protein [Kribbella qitaiheensis]QNE22560.1 erythromycin esterase family protein [Kribbella qitaiheensis]
MSQDIEDFVPSACELLALGEPTHQEPAFGSIRNDLFASLANHGFRSIALETDRVSALAVNDFVQEGTGTLDTVMSEGFTHNFGDLEANRRLVAWMREYNEGRTTEERLAFHGFDAPTENTSAPSPRRYLEYGRDYLGLDLDFANLLGADERWSREEAILDPAMSIGDSAEAPQLRAIADDLLFSLYLRAPELIAATSRADWYRARTHLTAGLGLLRYHKQAAQRIEEGARISRLVAARDALMAENLLDIRGIEEQRGATLVFAHNVHLQRNLSTMRMAGLDLDWSSAGAIVSSLLDSRYAVIAGSLGRSEALGLGEPDPNTYEGFLQRRITTAARSSDGAGPSSPTWGLTTAAAIPRAHKRTETLGPGKSYFPLEQPLIDSADAVLHINAAPVTTAHN